MIYIGIDPGLTGAIAVINSVGRLVGVWETPLIRLKKIRRKTYSDVGGMLHLLQGIVANSNDAVVAGIENVHGGVFGSNRKQGASSAFSFGRNFGVWEGLLTALDVTIYKIAPQTWKKAMHLTALDGKGESIIKAKALYPEADLTLKKHHNRAEAILISAYTSKYLLKPC